MKPVLITQRVDTIDHYHETRDALDQKWTAFLETVELYPIIVPNKAELLRYYLNENIAGIVLSGGSSTVKYGGNSIERDTLEERLLNWAIEIEKPVLGVCRGCQVILDYFHIPLIKVNAHVAISHDVNIQAGKYFSSGRKIVNSFHTLSTKVCKAPLKIQAISADGCVEAVEHETLPIIGLMWHPERHSPFEDNDLKIVNALFNETVES